MFEQASTRQVIGLQQAWTDEQERLRVTKRMTVGWPHFESMSRLSSGRYVVLAARPGVYKTTSGWCWANNMAASGKTVLWVGLEMSPGQMALMTMSRVSNIPRRHLEDFAAGHGTLTIEERARVMEAANKLDLPILYHSAPASLTSIFESIAKAKYDCIFLDYLQLVVTGAQKEYERVSQVSAALRDYAHQNNVLVVAMAQLNRELDKIPTPTTRYPRLSDLRGSGTIEQDADLVAFLHRPDADPRADRKVVELIIEKNRYGPAGIIRLEAKPEIAFIKEVG